MFKDKFCYTVYNTLIHCPETRDFSRTAWKINHLTLEKEEAQIQTWAKLLRFKRKAILVNKLSTSETAAVFCFSKTAVLSQQKKLQTQFLSQSFFPTYPLILRLEKQNRRLGLNSDIIKKWNHLKAEY